MLFTGIKHQLFRDCQHHGKHELDLYCSWSSHEIVLSQEVLQDPCACFDMGFYGDNGKENGHYYGGIMEKKMETTTVKWDNGK